jgi:hypothetical protein
MSLLLHDELDTFESARFQARWNNSEHMIGFLLTALLPAHNAGPGALQLRQWTDSPSTSTKPNPAHWLQFVNATNPEKGKVSRRLSWLIDHVSASIGAVDSDLTSDIAAIGRNGRSRIGRSRQEQIIAFMDSMVYWRALDARCEPPDEGTDTWETIAGAIVGLNDRSDRPHEHLTIAIRDIVSGDKVDSIAVFRPWRGLLP